MVRFLYKPFCILMVVLAVVGAFMTAVTVAIMALLSVIL